MNKMRYLSYRMYIAACACASLLFACLGVIWGMSLKNGLSLFPAVLLSLLAACLLAPEECVIHSCPDLSDVTASLDILRHLGCRVEREGHANTECDSRVRTITGRLEAADSSIGEFQDDTVRQLVSSMRVLDRERLSIRFKDGTEVEQIIECVGRASA